MTTITPTEECVLLRVKDTHHERNLSHVRDVVTRWLERMAAKKGRHINEPSVDLETDRDTKMRQTYLLGCAESFPDTLPDWLRTADIKSGVLNDKAAR